MNRPKVEEFEFLEEYAETLENYCDQLENKYSKLLDDVHNYRHEVQSIKVTVRNLCTHFGVNNEEELMKVYMPDGKVNKNETNIQHCTKRGKSTHSKNTG